MKKLCCFLAAASLCFCLPSPIQAYGEDYNIAAGQFGIGAGYNARFAPYKDLMNYTGRGGYFIQLTLEGTAFSLAYHRDYLDLKDSIAKSAGLANGRATLGRLTLGFNAPIPIISEKNFALAPTINYGFGGYRMVLEHEAYEKLGRTNLTKIDNKDLKFGQYVGIGLTTTIARRVNLNVGWNIDWVVHDYKAWYLITSSLVPLFIGETDRFAELMCGISIMFGKNP